ncbi:hypothetical protein D3C80_1898210 [compost metagenome]
MEYIVAGVFLKQLIDNGLEVAALNVLFGKLLLIFSQCDLFFGRKRHHVIRLNAGGIFHLEGQNSWPDVNSPDKSFNGFDRT